MKKAILLICGVIFFVGCANKIDPTPGDKCKPKWYKAESSDSKMVFGYSRERSRSSSLATSQNHCLQLLCNRMIFYLLHKICFYPSSNQ